MKIKSFYTTSSFFESDNFDEKNSYNFHNKYITNENNLSECDYNIENFKRFIEIVREETEKGDARPIYVFNLFEHLDESTDIAPFIDLLASLGRQVFVNIGTNHQIKHFIDACVDFVTFDMG